MFISHDINIRIIFVSLLALKVDCSWKLFYVLLVIIINLNPPQAFKLNLVEVCEICRILSILYDGLKDLFGPQGFVDGGG